MKPAKRKLDEIILLLDQTEQRNKHDKTVSFKQIE